MGSIVDETESETITKTELIEAIANSDSALTENVVYTSEFGYKILIQEGYQFNTIKEKKSFVITKNLADGSSVAIVINLLDVQDDLETTVAGTTEYLKSVNETYNFGIHSEIASPIGKGIRVPIEVIKDGVDTKGSMSFFKHNLNLFLITAVSTKLNWENLGAEINTTVDSFELLD